ncbi:aldolase catalytic domain-containing protein [Ruminiclostridium josui]|uniref:aldolase catalytic domain-containing protein n=1 Tax=Ruminiclostridium josui TaxID=1499 RepID=UPI000467B96A|nr:aldolase catalytic domain-containing protein [Ruminiclostridium josui]
MPYDENIKILDCTIRDGGLINNFNFKDDFVRAVYETCVDSNIDYMEIGYKADKKIFTGNQFGPWKFCNENDIRRIVGDNNTELKISVMADAERTDYHRDILRKTDSVIDMVRVATYAHQISTAVDMIKDAHDKGYETTINIMAVSLLSETILNNALEQLSKSEVEVIYIVDSFGSLYSKDIHRLVKKYMQYAKSEGKKVGIHCHNNQQLAYSNTIEAINHGAEYIDATIAGLGRGAGNCPIELILGFLKNPKYNLRPIIQCIEKHIPAIKKENNWGFDVAYMLTGLLNRHPREAIAFLDSKREDYTNFYDTIINSD